MPSLSTSRVAEREKRIRTKLSVIDLKCENEVTFGSVVDWTKLKYKPGKWYR